jgi:hypothetical protein
LTKGPRFKIKKASLQINNDLSSLESNLKTEELFLTTIFKKNLLSIWYSDSEEEVQEPARLSHLLQP